MIIFVYGKDSYRSVGYIHQLVEKFKTERDPQGMNVLRIDAEQTKAEDIWNAILSAPFMAEKRMIVLEHPIAASGLESFRAGLKEKIESKEIPESTILIIFESTDSFRKKEQKELFALLVDQKFTQRFDILEGTQLVAWIAAEVQSRGGEIHHQAAHMLATRIVGDHWKLGNTIDQLLAYCKGREITQQDIDVFVPPLVDDNVFHLVDAIVAARPQYVFEMLEEQYRQGKDPVYIFAMLLRQFRILLALKDAENRGESLQTVAKNLKIHSFVIKKSQSLVNKYSFERLKEIYAELLEIDEKMKTGGGEASVLIDIFVGKNLKIKN